MISDFLSLIQVYLLTPILDRLFHDFEIVKRDRPAKPQKTYSRHSYST